jgi:hypothetical protein
MVQTTTPSERANGRAPKGARAARLVKDSVRSWRFLIGGVSLVAAVVVAVGLLLWSTSRSTAPRIVINVRQGVQVDGRPTAVLANSQGQILYWARLDDPLIISCHLSRGSCPGGYEPIPVASGEYVVGIRLPSPITATRFDGSCYLQYQGYFLYRRSGMRVGDSLVDTALWVVATPGMLPYSRENIPIAWTFPAPCTTG